MGLVWSLLVRSSTGDPPSNTGEGFVPSQGNSMRNAHFFGLLTAVTLLASVGCAAPTESEDDATIAAEIVGTTDLTTLESKLGLTVATAQNPGDLGALRAGGCYRALIGGGGSREFEFRRYVHGAAFFRKMGSGVNTGRERPVLCLDINPPESALSLSGVGLDAVLRYDLGKITGQDAGMQKAHIVFQRGMLEFSNYDVTDAERVDSVKKRPHELPFEHASTIAGRLLQVAVKGVAVSSAMNGGTSRQEISIDGQAAYFLYRAAWRKSEDTGRFSVALDAVGAFKKTARLEGDGPGSMSTWQFTNGDVSYSAVGNFDGRAAPSSDEDLSLRAPGAMRDRAPVAQCVRSAPVDAPPPPFRCTGI